jgi:fatty-acyl-CoA synthase
MILDALRRRARDAPDALVCTLGDERLTCGALLSESLALAARMAAEGMGRHDRCVLLLHGGPDFLRAAYAAQLVGAAPVAIDPGLAPERIARRITAVEPRLVICDTAAPMPGLESLTHVPFTRLRDLARRASGPVPAGSEPDPGDPAYLQFTSGTTGEPRAAIVSHRALMAGLDAMRAHFDIGSRDVIASWSPVQFSPGLVRGVFGGVAYGCPVHLARLSALELGRWPAFAARTRATITAGADFAFRAACLGDAPPSLRTLRLATNGGEAPRMSTVEQFERRFGLRHVVQPAYGLSEATLIVASGIPGEPCSTDAHGVISCGRALPGLEVAIRDEQGRVCPSGVAGTIAVRGASIFDGYYRDPQSTAETLVDGWLMTGDIGTLDAAGRLHVRARARALLKRAGVGISPREIEEPVERLAGVIAAAAVGVASARGNTEETVVVVETTAGPPHARLAECVEAVVLKAVGFAPSRVVVTGAHAIPRTSTGKVRYLDLQQLVSDQVFLDAALFIT